MVGSPGFMTKNLLETEAHTKYGRRMSSYCNIQLEQHRRRHAIRFVTGLGTVLIPITCALRYQILSNTGVVILALVWMVGGITVHFWLFGEVCSAYRSLSCEL